VHTGLLDEWEVQRPDAGIPMTRSTILDEHVQVRFPLGALDQGAGYWRLHAPAPQVPDPTVDGIDHEVEIAPLVDALQPLPHLIPRRPQTRRIVPINPTRISSAQPTPA
jgi:hypothetical protein